MKRVLAVALTLVLLLAATGALAQEPIVFDEADRNDNEGCAATAEGNFVLALYQCDQAHYGDGLYGGETRLLCLSREGKVLWEQREEQTNASCKYAAPVVMLDGSLVVGYLVLAKDQPVRWALRRFSASGELLAERQLPKTTCAIKAATGGLLVTDRNEAENTAVYSVSLMDETLQPCWTLPGIRLSGRFDEAVRAGGECSLLLRHVNIRENVDELNLMTVRDDGQILHSLQLADEQMGYWGLCIDDDGKKLIALNAPQSGAQAEGGLLLCVNPDGAELWRKPFVLPEEQGRYTMCGFAAIEDGYLMLVLTQTETCLRLYRLNQEGAVQGYTDWHVAEDEMLLAPDLLHVGDAYWASAFVVRNDQKGEDHNVAELIPLQMP